MNTIIRAVVVCAALVSGAAIADGVPLITPGPAIPANHAANNLGQGHPEFVKLHSVVLNKSAFGANVLTVTIDGKEHRFVGALVPQPSLAQRTKKGMAPPVEQQVWSGRENGGAATLVLSKTVQSGEILGTIFLPPGRTFELSSPPNLGHAVLVETNRDLAPRPQRVAEPPAHPASGSR